MYVTQQKCEFLYWVMRQWARSDDVTVWNNRSLRDHCLKFVTYTRNYIKLQVKDFSLATACNGLKRYVIAPLTKTDLKRLKAAQLMTPFLLLDLSYRSAADCEITTAGNASRQNSFRGRKQWTSDRQHAKLGSFLSPSVFFNGKESWKNILIAGWIIYDIFICNSASPCWPSTNSN